MRAILKFFFVPLLLSLAVLSSFTGSGDMAPLAAFPYRKAGLTERQAAAHLISRFTYGARPGDVDAVLKAGLENWFAGQLKAENPDAELKKMLSPYDALSMSNSKVLQVYPRTARILAMAVQDSFIKKDALAVADRQEYRDQLQSYMQKKGLKPQGELYRQLVNQKILRAAFSENQLSEIMTEFWFNHFNVSVTKNSAAEFILSYERDVIRPNVFARFEDLVLATAKSPAMLMYLDNFSSAGPAPEAPPRIRAAAVRMADSAAMNKVTVKVQQVRKNQGLNENYAREVMELHTLGVDGGYTQSDVTQAARILTGWTVYPMENGYGAVAKNVLDKMTPEIMAKRGFIREGDFLFAANRHDQGEKSVLGKAFPAGGGYQEGVNLLKMLANHPSAARFISKKLAVRFVSDEPSDALVGRMAAAFSKSQGNISVVLTTMVSSPEFWSKKSLREKTKSPFELAMSAVRSLDASITQPYQLFTWVSRMGQKIYYYQAPTGFPDRGQYWINTGSLLSRMNFGLALASQKIPGVKADLAALNNNREPESSAAALVAYSKLIMPERDLSQTIQRLNPLLNDPELHQKVEQAALRNAVPQAGTSMTSEDAGLSKTGDKPVPLNRSQKSGTAVSSPMLAQVVGVILGSPEFQRK